MRFGIMTLQREAIIPHDMTNEQVVEYLSSFSHTELVRSLSDVGFNTIELGMDLALFLPQIFQPTEIAALADLKDELDLAYTVHLPLWSIEPSTPLEHVRTGSAQALVENIQMTLPLDPEVYVAHATGALAAEFYRMNLPDLAKGFILRQFQSKAKESLLWILSETGIPSRQLAIETVEFPFELTLELAEELDLSICLDTGHVLVGFSGPVSLDQTLESSLSRLAEIHLHDGPWQGHEQKIGYGQDHQPLGKGDLNIEPFLDLLVAAEFKGPIIFELQVQEALDSLDLIRSLRPNLIHS
jgi:sugar phosphate isomerase/epimerase